MERMQLIPRIARQVKAWNRFNDANFDAGVRVFVELPDTFVGGDVGQIRREIK